MSETYRIEGMTCGGCANAVTKAIQRLEPGAKVSVDLDSGLVTVQDGPRHEMIAKAAEGAGFTYRGPA